MTMLAKASFTSCFFDDTCSSLDYFPLISISSPRASGAVLRMPFHAMEAQHSSVRSFQLLDMSPQVFSL
jgi:hypothetical protein